MEFLDFVGREFSDEILVEAGDFVVISFEDERHVRVHISAWEIDGERFDLFFVKENDVIDDRFRETRAYFAEIGISEFENVYTFDLRHKRCLILSNIRAISRDKTIRIHLIRVEPSELTGFQYPTIIPKSKEDRPSQKIEWKNLGLLCIGLFIIGLVAYLVYFIHYILSTVLLTIVAILFSISKENVRRFLGL